MRYCAMLCLMISNFSAVTHPKAWHFSPAFLDQAQGNTILQNAPNNHVASPTSAETLSDVPTTEQMPWLCYTNAYTAVDLIALSYMAYQLGMLYKATNDTHASNQSWLASIARTFCPTLLSTMSARLLLIMQITGLALETLTYKTLAKLVLLCGQGDLFDLLKHKSKKVV